jgi:hypothetical protein
MWAVQVIPDNSAAIFALMPAVLPTYRFTTQVDAAYAAQGGTRITISRDGYPDQFVYPGEWILVIDAVYANGVWTVQPDTRIQAWGQSAGLAGTVSDFANTFTLV